MEQLMRAGLVVLSATQALAAPPEM